MNAKIGRMARFRSEGDETASLLNYIPRQQERCHEYGGILPTWISTSPELNLKRPALGLKPDSSSLCSNQICRLLAVFPDGLGQMVRITEGCLARFMAKKRSGLSEG